MTANQLAYLDLMEKQRKRIDEIAETKRSNLVKEAETMRSNLAKEAEVQRSNAANEASKIAEIQVKAMPNWMKTLGVGFASTGLPMVATTVNRLGRNQEQKRRQQLENDSSKDEEDENKQKKEFNPKVIKH